MSKLNILERILQESPKPRKRPIKTLERKSTFDLPPSNFRTENSSKTFENLLLKLENDNGNILSACVSDSSNPITPKESIETSDDQKKMPFETREILHK